MNAIELNKYILLLSLSVPMSQKKKYIKEINMI